MNFETSGRPFHHTCFIALGTRPWRCSWIHDPSPPSVFTLRTRPQPVSRDEGHGLHVSLQSRPTFLPTRRRFSRSSDLTCGTSRFARWYRWGESLRPHVMRRQPPVVSLTQFSSSFGAEESGFRDGPWFSSPSCALPPGAGPEPYSAG